MTEDRINDIVRLRVRVDELEQDLSDAVHLLYGVLVLFMKLAPYETRSRLAGALRLRLQQFSQDHGIGMLLIDLDNQFGGLLESKGIWLMRWLRESPERRYGSNREL